MDHPEMRTVRCALMRGGTSKGIYIMENQLPSDPAERDKVILAMYGSPDIRQINGVGGADPLTSKIAIVGPSSHPDADVDYTFGQVSITDAFVDYKGNCGNISAGVGPFAIDEGLVRADGDMATVRIHLTNSGNILVAEVPIKDGKAAVKGDMAIDGCPGTGAPITLDWSDTAGAFTGKLLPTGNVQDIIEVDGVSYPVSLVDCANPLVFITAESLGMSGTETPEEIESNAALMETIEKIRSKSAVIFGLVENEEEATKKSPYNPFFCIVSPSQDYECYNGKHVTASDVDIVSRLLFMQRMHKTHPGTGTVCLGAAVRIPGTIPNQNLSESAKDKMTVRIGHPSGVIPVEAEAEITDNGISIKRAAIYRTARRIMDGQVYIEK